MVCALYSTGTSKNQLSKRGFTLIECMIALLLGSMLSAIAMNMYLKSADFSRVSKSHQILNDNGSTALTLIGSYIRDAGFSDITEEIVRNTIMFNPAECGYGADNFCSRNYNNKSDVLALQLVPLNQRSCNGVKIDPGEKIVNVFKVDESEFELTCSSYSMTKKTWHVRDFPIQSGIEKMQIQYLLNDATSVSDPASTQQNSEDVVMGVSVSFLVKSDIENTVTPRARNFKLFDSQNMNVNDAQLRQVFQSSFLINNIYVRSNLAGQ